MPSQPVIARDIMVTSLIKLSPHMDLFDAIDKLLKYRISGAPVVDNHGNYLGVFSERSSISLLMSAIYDGVPTNEIARFVDRDAETVTEDTDLLTVAQKLMNTHYRRLPVLDEDGKLVGQISRRDVLKAARALLKMSDPSSSTILYLSSLHATVPAKIG